MLLSMASSKEKLVNVRLTPTVHEQFKIACELKGASMSSLMHQFIVRTIREEKEREPQAFNQQQGGAKTARLVIETPKQYDEKRKTG